MQTKKDRPPSYFRAQIKVARHNLHSVLFLAAFLIGSAQCVAQPATQLAITPTISPTAIDSDNRCL